MKRIASLLVVALSIVAPGCGENQPPRPKQAEKFGLIAAPSGISTARTSVLCRLTTAATTSTAITGCTAPGAGLSIYVTGVSVYGGVALGATAAATVQYGTGGTCGSGTTVIYECQHPATAGCEMAALNPLRLPANNELCLLDATVGTKFVTVRGYVAP